MSEKVKKVAKWVEKVFLYGLILVIGIRFGLLAEQDNLYTMENWSYAQVWTSVRDITSFVYAAFFVGSFILVPYLLYLKRYKNVLILLILLVVSAYLSAIINYRA